MIQMSSNVRQMFEFQEDDMEKTKKQVSLASYVRTGLYSISYVFIVCQTVQAGMAYTHNISSKIFPEVFNNRPFLTLNLDISY